MQNSTRFKTISFILKILVFVSAVLGIVFNAMRSLKLGNSVGNSFYYYTIQTNIITGLMSFIFFLSMIIKKKNSEIPQILYLFKYLSTAAITLTFIVFSVMLAPSMSRDYLFSGSNIFLHNCTPVLAIVDFIFFDAHFKSKKNHILLTTIIPLAYTFISLIFSFSGVRFYGGAVAPYFFLDYEKYGWLTLGREGLGVVIWVLLIAVLVLGLGYVLYISNRKFHRRK